MTNVQANVNANDSATARLHVEEYTAQILDIEKLLPLATYLTGNLAEAKAGLRKALNVLRANGDMDTQYLLLEHKWLLASC